MLDRDDIRSLLKEARGVAVAEFVQRRLQDPRALREPLESPQQMCLLSASGSWKHPLRLSWESL